MKLLDLVRKEVKHHKSTFALGLLSVVIAVGVLVGQLTVLKAHDIQTNHILTEKEKQIQDEMKQMEDDYRRMMEEHGLNLIILPKVQDTADFYDQGYGSKFMPEDYVDKLAESNLTTIDHLLPVIEQKIRWPEQENRTIFLVGIRGEVFSEKELKPIVAAVDPGNIALGYELWDSLGLKVGDAVRLLGENFRISKCSPQLGTKEDITVWINLGQAQGLLGEENQINAIQALQTYSSTLDFDSLRMDITRILPNTQIVILENEVKVLAGAIDRAKKTAKIYMATEVQYHSILRGKLETFATWLIPLVTIASMVLITMLTLRNVHERRPEIGILRALGYRSGQIFRMFIVKAFVLGLVGAILGYILGFGVAAVLGNSALVDIFDVKILAIALIAAPILSLLASWIPAMVAARQDPADVLREVI